MAVCKVRRRPKQAEQRVRNPRARDVPDFRRLRCVPPLPSADYRRHTGQGAGLCLRACRRRRYRHRWRSATFALTEMPRLPRPWHYRRFLTSRRRP